MNNLQPLIKVEKLNYNELTEEIEERWNGLRRKYIHDQRFLLLEYLSGKGLISLNTIMHEIFEGIMLGFNYEEKQLLLKKLRQFNKR